jgi:hypothetical protein
LSGAASANTIGTDLRRITATEIIMAITRRSILLGTSAALCLTQARMASAKSTIKVTKDPGCGCCDAWADHLRKEDFTVDVVESAKLNQLKARLGIPSDLRSCHTAEVDGYIIEGHVPAKAIRRLLTERPQLRGLAVPGMPVGSPGMEVEGRPADTYSVISFGPAGQQIYTRFEGAKELSAN